MPLRFSRSVSRSRRSPQAHPAGGKVSWHGHRHGPAVVVIVVHGFSERLLPEYSAVANRACVNSPPSFCSWYEQVAQQFPPRHSRHFSKSFTPVRLVLSERQLQICPHKNGRQLRGNQQFCDEFISGKKRHFPRHVVILKFVKARVSREHCARPSQPEPPRSYHNDCL